MNNHPKLLWFLVVLSTFFWGSNFNAAHILADSVSPLTAGAERFVIATFSFIVVRLWQGKPESQLLWKDALVLAPLGVIGVFGFNYAFFTALHTTSALNAALIMALSPLLSLLLSRWLLQTGVNQLQIVGIVVAFIGVTLVITGGDFGSLSVAIGDVWMLGACLAWSTYSVGSKKFASHIPPLQFARWTISFGAIALLVAALILESPLEEVPKISLPDHALLLYMGFCGGLLAYIFWLIGIQKLGADKTAPIFNLVPVFTLIVNLALGTVPTLGQIFGMLMVLFGVVVSTGWWPVFYRVARRPPA